MGDDEYAIADDGYGNGRHRVQDWMATGVGSGDDASHVGAYGYDRATTGVGHVMTGVARGMTGVKLAMMDLRRPSTGRGSGDDGHDPSWMGRIHSI